MSRFDDHYTFRDGLKSAVIRDLIGPGRDDVVAENEQLLPEAPMTRYISGVLYGRAPDPMVDAVEDNDHGDALAHGIEEAAADTPVSMANVRYPSAMAISFGIDADAVSTLQIHVTGGMYALTSDGDGAGQWERTAVSMVEEYEVLRSGEDTTRDLEHGLQLFVRERPAGPDGGAAITVALVNTREVPAGEWQKDPYSLFQAEFVVTSPEGDIFVDRTKVDVSGADEDADSFNLLYRHAPTFAVGHGCGATWTEATGGRASDVRTTFAPEHELLLADNNPDIDSPYFSMRRLAEDDRGAVVAGLRDFAQGYRDWIGERMNEVAAVPAGLVPTAEAHLADCVVAADRIAAGIDMLEQRDDVWLAFQLANRAMLVQRARSDWMGGDREAEPSLDSDDHRWRAFQIGFVLMALRGVADPDHDDRELVDLLWFPTGGGKTEAYLGLIAFTIFLRRLRAVKGGGTGAGLTVIMRYTLRLLTLQQFQRAAILICACEWIRRSRSDLGDAEISIGLWVGQGSTPKNLKDTKDALAALAGGTTPETKNPVQLLECPWCGDPLSHKNYWVRDVPPRRLVIQCKNDGCDFGEGVPAYVVDEDIDNYRPTLLLGTVDKFASLPWQDKVSSLFGIDDPEGPPELIIQDELHLISGPLGTMVGLYETAISWLCTDGGVGPKVIASTATIRRADDQIRQLYAAEGFQFPPPALDARDSYFAVEAGRDSKGTRTYLGLMAPGSSHATLMIRAYAAALQSASELDGDDSVRDAYWTLLGYFNSLRVLGGALLQVRDDVVDRVAVNATASGHEPRFTDRTLVPPIEMTSRVASSKIPQHLELMGTPLGEPNVQDVVLATNMISVGVDVDRLGLMAVMGQPQSSSEYIQATSRIGRRHPGLVMTLFNAARSRDRSHFEDFVAFHSSLYRRVDASSVTPFAPRARDRALHAVFIGLLRARSPEYRPNTSASQTENLDLAAEPVIRLILERVAKVDPNEVGPTDESLRRLVKNWKRRAEEQEGLVFSNPFKPELALLADASRPEIAEQHDALATMWSMRAVDTESELYLI